MSLLRLLTSEDSQAFQQLRIKAVEVDGPAFLSDIETERAKTLQRFTNELTFAQLLPPFGYYGLFNYQQLIGFVQLGTTGLPKQQHIGYLYNLFIDPKYRGQGQATLLCQTILQTAREQGLERIFAVCLASNRPAYQLYTKLGFSQCGRRPQSVKWQNVYDDEVELVKVL